MVWRVQVVQPQPFVMLLDQDQGTLELGERSRDEGVKGVRGTRQDVLFAIVEVILGWEREREVDTLCIRVYTGRENQETGADWDRVIQRIASGLD